MREVVPYFFKETSHQKFPDWEVVILVSRLSYHHPVLDCVQYACDQKLAHSNRPGNEAKYACDQKLDGGEGLGMRLGR